MALLEDLESLDMESLQLRLDELRETNESVAKENAVLAVYLSRHVSAAEQEEWAGEEDAKRAGSARKSRAKRKFAAASNKVLTLDNKLEVAGAELDAAKKETATMRALSTKTLDKLRALLQQNDARIGALKAEAFAMKKDVVIGGENALSGRIKAEKMVRFYEDSLRRKDNAVEQLRLKCESLRAQLVKGRAALKRKEEVGDTLHFIDFMQLQIENKQLAARLEERNAELVRLKGSTSATLKTQNALKSRLAELLQECGRLRQEIRTRNAVLARLQVENAGVAAELGGLRVTAAALAKTEQLQQEGGGSAFDLPSTSDYVMLTALEKELRREASSWERKVEVAELAARTSAAAAAASLRRRTGSLSSSTYGSSTGDPVASYGDGNSSSSGSSGKRQPWQGGGPSSGGVTGLPAAGRNVSKVAAFPVQTTTARWGRMLPTATAAVVRSTSTAGGGAIVVKGKVSLGRPQAPALPVTKPLPAAAIYSADQKKMTQQLSQ